MLVRGWRIETACALRDKAAADTAARLLHNATAAVDCTCIVGIARGGTLLARGLAEVRRLQGGDMAVAICTVDRRGVRLDYDDGIRPMEPDSRVLLVDDVVNSGRTALKAIRGLEAGGAGVAGLACLIQYPTSKPLLLRRWPGQLLTVFTLRDLSLCRFGVRRNHP